MKDFVFHEEYIIDIPADRLQEFQSYIIKYGLYGEIPELKGFEFTFWKTIQRRIDIDKSFYEITCLKRKLNAINTRINNNKATDKDMKNLELYTNKLNELNELNEVKRNNSFKTKQTKLNELNEVKLTHYDTDSDIDTDTDSDIDTDTDYDTDIDTDTVQKQNAPSLTSPMHKKYSKEIFNLFKDAELPCARNNEISFIQTDFKNAIDYLHKTSEFQHISSEDIIGAVKNYISTLQNPDSYVSTKMNFFSLVKSKNFYNYLPANFDADNFKKFESKNAVEEKKEEYVDYEKVYLSESCPKCKGHKVFINPNIKKRVCDDCFYVWSQK